MVDLDALPVAVAVSAARDTAVRRLVEGALGWQVVDHTGGLAPAVVLADVAASGPAPVPAGVPLVLLVAADDDAVAAAGAAAGTPAAAVVAWPTPAEGLADAVAAVLAGRSPADGPTRLVVGGSAGGVGTTTTALALAGLAAWSGARVLVVTSPDAPVPHLPVVRTAALAGPRAVAAAVRVPGVPGLRALATDLPAGPGVALPPGPDLVVVDRGVAGAGGTCDVLVAGHDRRGLDAVGSTPAGAVVLRGDGQRLPARLRGAVGGRPLVLAPSSERVARAEAAGRVPAGLPGAWLARLAPLVAGVVPAPPVHSRVTAGGDGRGAPA